MQQGKPIVMLHNSGGCVTAFSWLQRVMAHMRPPPEANRLRGPLRFLIANLSSANWTSDFGAPEVSVTTTLAVIALPSCHLHPAPHLTSPSLSP